jgi:hypothetical protein
MNVSDVTRKPEAHLLMRCPQGHEYKTGLYHWRMDDEGGIDGLAGSDQHYCPECDEHPEVIGIQIGEVVL